MTMRLDIVTNDAGELVRREHARELGAGVTVSIYRLAKLAQMHDLGNQAFLRQLEQTHQGIQDYCLRAGMNVNILFAQRAIFVAGQLLKGNRAVYEQATELGEIMEWLGGSDFTVARDITLEELRAFAESISMAMRSQRGAWQSPTPKIRLRQVADAARLRGLELENLTFDQRIVRTYASAVVIMRRFFEDLQESRYILPRRIKRVAQSLVDLSSGNTPSFLGVTEVRNQNHDEAGRAVNTAILAVAMAREVTDDRQLLAQIAMAAMMHDVGRPRAAALGMAGGAPMGMAPMTTTLSEDQEDRLPAGTAAVLTALGRVNEPSITRTVVAFESLWLRRQRWIGPIYRGVRPPTVHAKMIMIARRYNDLLTPEPGLPPPTPDFAVATLSEELKEPQDKTILRMLVAALGLVPVGTVVQLSTGEIAEVIRGGVTLDRPRVRIVMDAQGGMLPAPIDVDLARPNPKDPPRKIIRVMNVDGWRKGLDRGSDPEMPAVSEQQMRASAEISNRGMPAPGESSPPHRAPSQSRPAPNEQSNRSDSNSNVSSVSHASFPSLGSSPSAVAEAMGRMINDSLYPDELGGRSEGKQAPDDFRGRGRPTRPPPTQEPTARGTLAATPLAHVLVYMLDHALTGAVVFYEQDGYEHDIYFQHGIPAKVRLGRMVALLGEELILMGAMERAVLDNAVESARRLGVLIGEFLVGENLVSRDVLARALETQLLKKVAALANLPPETSYAYYRDMNTIAEWGGREIALGGPLNPILATVRAWHDRARVRATLSRIGKHPLVFHEEADLASMLLTPQEKLVIDTIRNESCSLPQLYKKKIADDEVVSSLVYTLAVTRQFAFKGQKKGPMATRSALPASAFVGAASASNAPSSSRHGALQSGVSAAPGSVAPAAAAAGGFAGAQRTVALPAPNVPTSPPSAPQHTVAMPHQAPPGATPVPPPAAQSAVSRAPLPPPQGPQRPPLQPLTRPAIRPIGGGPKIMGGPPSANGTRPSVAPASSGRLPAAPASKAAPRIAAAPRGSPPSIAPAPQSKRGEESIEIDMSSGESKPATYSNPPTEVAALAPEFEEAEKALEAMTNFRLAETALQRGDIAGAEALAKKAVEGDPEQSEYKVLFAWIRAMGSAPNAVDEAIEVMSAVLEEDAGNERALLYRGKLYKRANKLKEAQKDFNALLATNPQHREAASEVRLLKLRK
jgi:hypothetical protein